MSELDTKKERIVLGKFNLNQLLMNSGSGSTPGKPAESSEYKITHISVHDLMPSEDNFYATQQIEELKASVGAFGIKQNLIVAPTEGGKYRVIAGHRRRLAVLALLEEGKAELERVPCMVETDEDELRERLLLITTNSTTRILTDWEKIKQAEELRTILEQIKKRDKIPGRLRDLIASTLDTSAAQVGRMEAIAKHLTPVFQEELKAERVNLSTAYEISGLPPEQQQQVYEEYQERGSVSIKDVREHKQEQAVPDPIPEPKSEEEAQEEEDEPEPPESEQQDDSAEDDYGHELELREPVEVEDVHYDSGPVVIHDLKTLPQFYQAVITGAKPFEVRWNDRGYKVGDILQLWEWSEQTGYTGRSCRKIVTYTLDDPEYVKEGFIIMGWSEGQCVN